MIFHKIYNPIEYSVTEILIQEKSVFEYLYKEVIPFILINTTQKI